MSDIDDLDALFQEDEVAARPLDWNDLLDATAKLVPARRIVLAVIAFLIALALWTLVWTPVLSQTSLWLNPPEGYSGFISVAVPSIAVSAVAMFFTAIAGGLALANQLRPAYALAVPFFALAAVLFVAVMELNSGTTLAELLPF